MNFFINETMHAQKSGIEHAELKRFNLFNEHGADCRIVIRNWIRNCTTTRGKLGSRTLS